MRASRGHELSYNFMAVITARLTSNFGTFLSQMALNVFVLELTGSAKWMGLALAIKVLSGMLATPFIGQAVDRFDRKRLMIVADLVLAASTALLVLMPPAVVRYYIILLMFLGGIFSNLFDVALSAATPAILGTRDTLKANSWFLGGRNLVMAASALCAVGASYLFKGYTAIFLLDAATYLFSALVLASLSIRTTEEPAAATPARQGFWERLRRDFTEVRGLENARTVGLFLFILTLDAFASGSHNLGWPVFSRSLLPEKPLYYYGLILFFWAGGNIAGIYHLNRQRWLQRVKPEALYLGATGLMSLGMILTFQTNVTWFIALASFLAGLGDGTYQTYLATYLQQAPDSMLGKVFALSGLALRTGFGLGFLAVPFVLERLSVAVTVLLFHGAVLAAVAFVFLAPGARALMRSPASR